MNNKNSISINCNGAELILSHERAVFWGKESMLILSDLHLGKTAHFRKSGIAIPSSVMTADLQRLGKLILEQNARKVLVVGDMFHNDFNSDLQLFKEWKHNFPTVDFILVPGNHDRLSKSHYELLDIQVKHDCFTVAPLAFTHEYVCGKEEGYFISGHVHPGVLLRGRVNQQIKLPCFVKTNTHLVLPAFSKFTGLDTRTYVPGNGNIFYGFTDTGVFKL